MQELNKKFITVEGIEGVGKTTAVKIIHDYFLQQQQEIVLTREPGGTLLAEELRKILLTPTKEIITADTELLLMFACRSQHLANVILPALRAGKWVVSDRFVDASYAYQGGGRKIAMEKIALLDQWIVEGLRPRLTILLDAPPEIGLRRASLRSEHDRIEQEKIDFFERVREIYLQRAKIFPTQFYIIDATQSLENVRQALKEKLNTLFASNSCAN